MRAGAAVFLALTLAATPVSAQIGRTEVKQVRFEGNDHFSADLLSRAIVTRETRCRTGWFWPVCQFGIALERSYLDRRELPRDSLRLKVWYQRRGFREAEVSYSVAPVVDSATTVTFTIAEGRPVLVDTVMIPGADEFEGLGLLDNLPLRKGDHLSTIQMDAERDTLTRRLANNGYARADVLRNYFIPSDHPYQARVTFDIAAGARAHYDSIMVDWGPDSLKHSLSRTTVLRTLQFRSGDLYRLDQILEGQARLFGLQIIRNASVQPDLQSQPDSVIPVTVTIEEGPVHRVRAGAGWSDAECFNIDSRWTSRNFHGGGRQLQVRGRVSNLLATTYGDLLCPKVGGGDYGKRTWLASVDFTQPWIFSTRNSFTASLFGERQSVPDIFVRNAVGMSFTLTRSLGARTPLTLSYRPERSSLTAAEVLLCTSFLVCTPRDVSILQGKNWLAPIGLNFTRNLTNNVLNPSRGHSMVVDYEHAARWTGSEFSYDRVVFDGTDYERLFGQTILAAHVRMGWVGAASFRPLSGSTGGGTGIVHPQKRFYAGGANSVRGFAQNRLGPRVLQVDVSNLLQPDSAGAGAGCSVAEVQALTCDASPLEDSYFTPRATGGTRLFEGNLEVRFPLKWNLQGVTFTDFGQVWDRGDPLTLHSIQVTPGVGVRYMSPIGPIRVDLAYRFRGGQDLSVVTTGIRPYDPQQDAAADRLQVNGQAIPWVRSRDLAVLGPPVFYGETPALSMRRFQLHFSIGQAF